MLEEDLALRQMNSRASVTFAPTNKRAFRTAERLIRMLKTKAASLLIDVNLDDIYIGDVVLHVHILCNAKSHKTPKQIPFAAVNTGFHDGWSQQIPKFGSVSGLQRYLSGFATKAQI